VSPDLTRADPGIPPGLDPAAIADIETNRNGRRGVIYTIAPSPLRAPLLWIGTDDGQIQLTSDDGKSWQNVTPAAISSWSKITMIEASHFDANTAYASADRHQLQDFDPYIYRTRDLGKTWQKITSGLPAGVYVHVVKEDPSRKGLLFAGTERGAWMSLDDGDSWQPLRLNLPVTSVRDFEIYQNDLIVATHGRGFWVIDDISPLRQLDATVLASDAYLFKPGDSINYLAGADTGSAFGGDNGTPLQRDEAQAPNPPNGATIDYYLKSAATGPVKIEILDSTGAVLRTYSSLPPTAADSAAAAGGGRVRASRGIPNVSPLWIPEPQAPIPSGPGMHRIVWSPVVVPPRPAGGGFGRGEPIILAGQFTARMTVGGKSYTQSFTVKPDPRTPTAA
jgi:hypothetical protein